MSMAELVRNMAAAGATPEAIAIAVEAVEAVQYADVERRAKRAAQKRKEREASRDKDATVARQDCDKGATVEDKGSPKVSPQRDINQTPLPNPSKSSLRSEENGREAAEFAAFRQTYPRRRGDNWDKARKSFGKAVRSGVDPEAIVSGAAAYAASREGEDPQFTQMAATWLNQRGWEVDYAPLKGARAPPKPGSGGGFASLLADSIREKHERAQQPERCNFQDVPLLSVRDEAGRSDGGDDDGGVHGHSARVLIGRSFRSM